MNQVEQSSARLTREDVLQMIDKIPASNVENYLFKNNWLTFSNVSKIGA
jgi:hypothetical protein